MLNPSLLEHKYFWWIIEEVSSGNRARRSPRRLADRNTQTRYHSQVSKCYVMVWDAQHMLSESVAKQDGLLTESTISIVFRVIAWHKGSERFFWFLCRCQDYFTYTSATSTKVVPRANPQPSAGCWINLSEWKPAWAGFEVTATHSYWHKAPRSLRSAIALTSWFRRPWTYATPNRLICNDAVECGLCSLYLRKTQILQRIRCDPRPTAPKAAMRNVNPQLRSEKRTNDGNHKW